MAQTTLAFVPRWLALFCLLLSPATFAQAKVAVPILLKVLTYDQSFDQRGTGPFTIAVVAEAGHEGPRDALMEELKTLTITSIKNRPLRFVSLSFKDEKSLQSEVERLHVDALLAVPSLSPTGVGTVSAVAELTKRYSLSLDATMVERALCVGVSTVSGRPQILINDRASKAVGAQFEASVLKLARVVH